MTAYMTIFNLFAWTHGIITVSGKSDRKAIRNALISPSVIATLAGFVFFVGKIILPNVLLEAMTYIGDMNTPLAMLVAGITIAQADLLQLIRKVRVYYITFFKLLFVPVSMLLLFAMFDIPRTVLLSAVLAAACPTAATVNLFAIRFDKNYLYASELFAVTTIFSLLTIPAIMMLANFII